LTVAAGGGGLESPRRRFSCFTARLAGFGHFVIAITFVGAFRDPVRNRWLFDFGLIACGLVIPYALLFGQVRGIPFWWRLIDCSFGVMGFVPLWFCRKWAGRWCQRKSPRPVDRQPACRSATLVI
jgi:hypothetical protein